MKESTESLAHTYRLYGWHGQELPKDEDLPHGQHLLTEKRVERKWGMRVSDSLLSRSACATPPPSPPPPLLPPSSLSKQLPHLLNKRRAAIALGALGQDGKLLQGPRARVRVHGFLIVIGGAWKGGRG